MLSTLHRVPIPLGSRVSVAQISGNIYDFGETGAVDQLIDRFNNCTTHSIGKFVCEPNFEK